MITPLTYGHSSKTSMAYYYFGIAGNFSKLAQGGPVVEAAWLAALQNTFSFPLSNLKARRVDVYSNVQATNRFNPPSVGSLANLPAIVKGPRLFPTAAGWTVWS
jgi:hypothetical protein